MVVHICNSLMPMVLKILQAIDMFKCKMRARVDFYRILASAKYMWLDKSNNWGQVIHLFKAELPLKCFRKELVLFRLRLGCFQATGLV